MDSPLIEEADPNPVNLHEYQVAARNALPIMAFDYIAGGSGDEITLRANRQAFDRWRIVPRVLRGVTRPSLETTVLGSSISLPVLLAPVGFHRLAHSEGERASARAARDANTILICSTASTYSIEDIAPCAGPWWFQLYIFRDREITRHLIERAEAAGASALVVTVDTPVAGRREADERNRFALPDGVVWANLQHSVHESMPATGEGSGLASYIATSFEPALDWADLDWLSSLTSLPIILKGILAAEDARLALEHGARAIIVSNHGGRQLDSAIASLDSLPGIVEAVEKKVEVLMDGGIRRGTDIVKALALGARAVLIGRPFIWGLAVGGEAGVKRVLDLLAAELTLDLTLCGAASVQDVNRSLLVALP
ncbi:MAG: alpha-hydroxy acid oxidase [Chloroflexota bacterium]